MMHAEEGELLEQKTKNVISLFTKYKVLLIISLGLQATCSEGELSDHKLYSLNLA